MTLWCIYAASIYCLTRTTSHNSSCSSVLRYPYAALLFCIFMAEFFIHLFRSQANQPAAHLTSRSFICIFAELFSVYSSPLCISEDPHISLSLSLFLSSHSLVLRCVCHRCFYEMLMVNISFLVFLFII